MAIESVKITFQAKKVGGQFVNFSAPSGQLQSVITGEASTRSGAEAIIQNFINASIVAAQGVVQDQQDASGAFGS